MVIDTDFQPPYSEEPFYGLLVFGGRESTFAVVQFPEPGYENIAEIITIPQMSLTGIPEETVAVSDTHLPPIMKFSANKATPPPMEPLPGTIQSRIRWRPKGSPQRIQSRR